MTNFVAAPLQGEYRPGNSVVDVGIVLVEEHIVVLLAVAHASVAVISQLSSSSFRQ